ncbi:uncharacterized protein LOC141851027 [Brevipalpus obovatus]|uniref:uncharacterized protein LOC141851027 n=1 Tax=Brevipalpus obovatus TaxID=246614 RepID=UPI003D9EB988
MSHSHFFGITPPSENIDIKEVRHWFALAKKAINKFKLFMISKSNCKELDWAKIRQDVESLLNFFVDADPEEEYRAGLRDELMKLMTFTGKISKIVKEFDMNLTSLVGDEKSASHHYVTMCMNVWWIGCKILTEDFQRDNVVYLLKKVDEPIEFSFYLTQAMLDDVVALTFSPFSTSCGNPKSLISTKAFLCERHKHLYQELIKVVCKDNVLFNDHRFWFYVNPLISRLLKRNKAEGSPDLHIICSISKSNDIGYYGKDSELVVLWFASNMMEMLRELSPENSKNEICNSELLKTAIVGILEKVEDVRPTPYELLEVSLQFVIKIIKFCDPCIDFVLAYIEYFKRVLSRPSPDTSSKIVPVTGYSWCRRLEIITYDGPLPDSMDKAFDLFLRLLTKSVLKLLVVSDRQCISRFQKIKGRLSSSFLQPKKIESMDSATLYKFITILIVLRIVAKENFSDFTEKLDYISNVLHQRIAVDPQFLEKITVVVLAVSSATLYTTSQSDAQQLSKLMETIFNRTCSILGPNDGSRIEQRHSLITDFAVMYFDEITQILEIKGDCFDSVELIPEQSRLLLSRLIDRDLQAFLNASHKLIKTVKDILLRNIDDSLEHKLKTLITRVIVIFEPYIKIQFTKMGQFDLSRMAADMTLLILLQEPGRVSIARFREAFIFFSCSQAAGNQCDRYCDLIFYDSPPIVHQQLKYLFIELISRYVRSDKRGQASMDKQKIILRLMIIAKGVDQTDAEEYFRDRLKEFIRTDLLRKCPANVIKVLEICWTVLPAIKASLMSCISQRIWELEKEQASGTVDSIRKVFQQSYNP